MDPKAKSALDKALTEKLRGNHDKALKKLQEAIRSFPSEPALYLEAADVCFEAGESLGATQFLKKAHTRFADERERIVELARERASATNDPVIGKFLLEQLVKRRDLSGALECLNDLQDRAIRDLLQRSRTKRQSLHSASAGGYSLTGEMITNALSEGVLCLRLGRFKEAVRTLLQVVEDKPVENEVVEPFFSRLEKAHPKSGRIRIGYAISLLAANNPEAAMTRFVQAAQAESPLADECLERVREYRDGVEHPAPSVDLAIFELLLIRNSYDEAAEVVERVLETHSDGAMEIMEMIRPHLDAAETLSLHYVFMDAALAAEQTVRVMETLRAIRRDEDRREELMGWLDRRAGESFLPPDVMIFHGELAIDTGHYDRAHEILAAVCSASPGDVGSVMRLLERSKGKDRKLDELFEEHASRDPSRSASSGAEFEHFENSEFQFSSGNGGELEVEKEREPEAQEREPEPEPASEPEPGVKLDRPLSLGGDDEDEGYDPDFDNFSGKSVFRNTETKVAGEVVWEEEDESGHVDPPVGRPPAREPEVASPAPEPEPEPVETPAREVEPVDSPEPRESAEAEEETEVRETPDTVATGDAEAAEPPHGAVTAEYVDHLARALRVAGAATFFHLDGGGSETEEPVGEPEPTATGAMESSTEPVEASERSESREAQTEDREEPEADEPDPMDADLDVAVPELIETGEESLDEAVALEKDTSLVTDI